MDRYIGGGGDKSWVGGLHNKTTLFGTTYEVDEGHCWIVCGWGRSSMADVFLRVLDNGRN